MADVIVGIDCASVEKNVGLALGAVERGELTIREIAAGGGSHSVVELIARWLPPGQPALLAFDAPLGWPAAMGPELFNHSAGMPLTAPPDVLFSRLTDRIIRQKIKKRPLEVGANLIARTAHAALGLLQHLREETGLAIPLAWEPDHLEETCAIEVYPAATLLVYNIRVPNYKLLRAQAARRKLVTLLSSYMAVATEPERLVANSHTLDAAVCVLAGYDFLSGRCIRPDDFRTARKEGWIWVRHPFQSRQ